MTHATPPNLASGSHPVATTRWSIAKLLGGRAISCITNNPKSFVLGALSSIGCILAAPIAGLPLIPSLAATITVIPLSIRGVNKTANFISNWWNTPRYKYSEADIADHDHRVSDLIKSSGSVNEKTQKNLDYILRSGPMSEEGRSEAVATAIRLKKPNLLVQLLTTGHTDENQYRFISLNARMQALKYGVTIENGNIIIASLATHFGTEVAGRLQWLNLDFSIVQRESLYRTISNGLLDAIQSLPNDETANYLASQLIFKPDLVLSDEARLAILQKISDSELAQIIANKSEKQLRGKAIRQAKRDHKPAEFIQALKNSGSYPITCIFIK